MDPSVELITLLVTLLSTLGVPLLLVVFYFDGLVIGKAVRPGAVFVLYLLIVRPEGSLLLAIAVGCAVATTLGQWTMYRAFNDERPEIIGLRRRVSYLDRALQRAQTRVESRRMRLVTRIFNRFGGVAVGLSNLIPGVRCLMSIPAGLSRYPVKRFVIYSLVGNLLYMGVLIGITRGVLGLARFLPWR